LDKVFDWFVNLYYDLADCLAEFWVGAVTIMLDQRAEDLMVSGPNRVQEGDVLINVDVHLNCPVCCRDELDTSFAPAPVIIVVESFDHWILVEIHPLSLLLRWCLLSIEEAGWVGHHRHQDIFQCCVPNVLWNNWSMVDYNVLQNLNLWPSYLISELLWDVLHFQEHFLPNLRNVDLCLSHADVARP